MGTLTETFGELVTPLSMLKLDEEGGNTRVVYALRRPAEDGAILLAAAGGQRSTPVQYDLANTPVASEELFKGLTGQARLSLSSAILGSWANLFKLRSNASFILALRKLFITPSARGGMQILFSAGGVAVVEAVVPPGFGPAKSGHFVYTDRIKQTKLIPMAVRPTDRSSGIRRYF